jgi:hypothetical protein
VNSESPLQRAIRLHREKIERERLEREAAEVQRKDPRFAWPATQKLLELEIKTANATLETGDFEYRYDLRLDPEPLEGIVSGGINIETADESVGIVSAFALDENGIFRVFVETGVVLAVPVWGLSGDTVQRLLGQLYEKMLNGRGEAAV